MTEIKTLDRLIIKMHMPHPPRSKSSASSQSFDDIRNRIMEAASAAGIEVPSARQAVLHVTLPYKFDIDNRLPGIICLLDQRSSRGVGLLADDRQIVELHVRKCADADSYDQSVTVEVENTIDPPAAKRP